MALSLGLMSTGHGKPAFPNRRLISPKAPVVSAVVAELREALLEADVDAETCSSTKIVIKSPGRLARSCPSKRLVSVLACLRKNGTVSRCRDRRTRRNIDALRWKIPSADLGASGERDRNDQHHHFKHEGLHDDHRLLFAYCNILLTESIAFEFTS